MASRSISRHLDHSPIFDDRSQGKQGPRSGERSCHLALVCRENYSPIGCGFSFYFLVVFSSLQDVFLRVLLFPLSYDENFKIPHQNPKHTSLSVPSGRPAKSKICMCVEMTLDTFSSNQKWRLSWEITSYFMLMSKLILKIDRKLQVRIFSGVK